MQVKVHNDWAEKTNKDPWIGKTNEMLVDPWYIDGHHVGVTAVHRFSDAGLAIDKG